jgi:NhaD family Na+/H+ antiporter
MYRPVKRIKFMSFVYIGLIILFTLGYAGIIFEKIINQNKAATAILMASLCWLLFFVGHGGSKEAFNVLKEQSADIAQIIFFLLAVMAIVELIDSHHGFKMVTDRMYAPSKKRMFWYVMLVSFFMSSILDNLTSMIVMISLLRKMVPSREERWFFGSAVVISVNAGGAWTPIGDVTTTMLWINERITTWQTIKNLFLPSIVCALVAGLICSFYIKGKSHPMGESYTKKMEPGAKLVLFIGVAALLLIPVWKALFNLPPFMGALIGLGVLWVITDFLHYKFHEKRLHLRVPAILSKIDVSGILFFLGILFAVSSLTAAGILKDFALFLERIFPNENIVAILIGLISSVIDNVPLVAATFGMYDLAQFPTDSTLWQLIAYAAGTGGSILIIGSAAGVAFMGLEHVTFFWYLKKIAWIALISYFAGILVYYVTIPFLAAF